MTYVITLDKQQPASGVPIFYVGNEEERTVFLLL